MLCINNILHFNMHLLLCSPILCINLAFRFGAHKLRLGSILPLAHIYYHDQDNDLMSWSCVNCPNAVIDLYITLYLRDVYGNESCQKEIELNWFRWWLGAVMAASHCLRHYRPRSRSTHGVIRSQCVNMRTYLIYFGCVAVSCAS